MSNETKDEITKRIDRIEWLAHLQGDESTTKKLYDLYEAEIVELKKEILEMFE